MKRVENAVTKLENTLAKAVSTKLDYPCRFVRWIELSTGDVPVFEIPPSLRQLANELGLYYHE